MSLDNNVSPTLLNASLIVEARRLMRELVAMTNKHDPSTGFTVAAIDAREVHHRAWLAALALSEFAGTYPDGSRVNPGAFDRAKEFADQLERERIASQRPRPATDTGD